MNLKTIAFTSLLAVPLLVLYEVVGQEIEGATVHILRLLITVGWLMIVNSLNSRWQPDQAGQLGRRRGREPDQRERD